VSEPRRKVRVGVLFGGRSSEHAVSCASAASLLAALDRDRFEAVPIGITPEGRWVLAADDPERWVLTAERTPRVDATGTVPALPGDPAATGLVALAGGDASVDLGRLDVVFPLLHGPFGEDGTVQGLLELAGVPYVGSGVLASALAMDKEYMKLALAARGLPVGRYAVVRSAELAADRERVLQRLAALGLPVFVKPARGGSSLGISRAGDVPGLLAALDVAHREDPKALVEAAVTAREIECGVLEGVAGGPPEASLPAEIHPAEGRPFYDFAAKYFAGGASFDVPAALPDGLTERVRGLACEAFDALGCEGLARVDFFLTPDDGLLVNEVNTMPGFTPASMFPRMWAATGLDYPALVERMLRAALDRPSGLR
jgi:D-alanine-D-alanine ligase